MMQRDFTLRTYFRLLETLLRKGFIFTTLKNHLSKQNYMINDQLSLDDTSKFKIQNSKLAILRHDVDRLPKNSLETARIEFEMNIKGSYYFRIVPESYDDSLIKEISKLGHEIGYHYEDVDLVLRSQNRKIDEEKLIDLAYESFCRNLEIFRKNFEIKTICMHGSPLSKYDNKIIWKKYNYKDLGILGEPYFDLDFNEFGYLTDTGRKWNGSESSVRDKVNSKFILNFKTTQSIINNILNLPDRVMLTIHPQRWNDKLLPWLNEYFSQNLKNVIKKNIYVHK